MSAQPHPTARETRWVDPRALSPARTCGRSPNRTRADRVGPGHGVIQPPVVYAEGADLVPLAGHRRTAAAIAAGCERIEVAIAPRLDERPSRRPSVGEHEPGRAARRGGGRRRGADDPARGTRRADRQSSRATPGPGGGRPPGRRGQQGSQGRHRRGTRADPGTGRRADRGVMIPTRWRTCCPRPRTARSHSPTPKPGWPSNAPRAGRHRRSGRRGYQVMNPMGARGRPPGRPTPGTWSTRKATKVGGRLLRGRRGPGREPGPGSGGQRVPNGLGAGGVPEPEGQRAEQGTQPLCQGPTAVDRQDRAKVIAGNKAWRPATTVRHTHVGR